MEEWQVIIIGAGPSGLATAASLNTLSIPNLILEREDCSASLWRKRVHGCFNLHLSKELCKLPNLPFPSELPTYVPKDDFVCYIDEYTSHFDVHPKYCRSVDYAYYDEVWKKWIINVKNVTSSVSEIYYADFMVVATGEYGKGYIPEFPGADTFLGESIHSSEYISGSTYKGKNVLVIGSGNSGMEIAHDLSNHGAHTSIIIKSPVHVLTKEIANIGVLLCLTKLPVDKVDRSVMGRVNKHFGDLSQHGLVRPAEGPFYLRTTTGKFPVIDVGTIDKILKGDINVLPALSTIEKDSVVFANGERHNFDALIFATGYRKPNNHWIKGHDSYLDEDGMPKESFLDHWKGLNGLYFVGFARGGLAGIVVDAKAVADDIKSVIGLKPLL